MSVSRLARVAALTAGLAIVPFAVGAQRAGRVPRIGALVVASPSFPPVDGFRQNLRELGYTEGQSIVVEYRYAEGRVDRYRDLAVEMVRREPDVIVVWGTELAQSVRRATATIPIVLALGDRPVEALRRAARVGDGWIVYLVTPARFRASLEKIRRFAAELGRPLDPERGFEPAHVLFTVVDEDPEAARATAARYLEAQYNQFFDDLARKYCLLGPPAACAERLAEFVAAGVRTFVIYFAVPPGRLLEQLGRFGTEVRAVVPEWAGPGPALAAPWRT